MAKLHNSGRDKLEPRNDQGFLSRWSQRKQAQHEVTSNSDVTAPELPADAVIDTLTADAPGVTESASALVSEEQNEQQTELSAHPAEVESSASAPAVTGDQAENPEEEVLLSDADMPPLEHLQKDSDVSMFFNRGVSRELRKSALRKLFSLPALNITDGLNDYDEDYTTFEPLGDIITSDMKFHAERKARLAEEAEAEKRAALEAENEAGEADEAEAESREDELESQETAEADTEAESVVEGRSELDSELAEDGSIEADNVRSAAERSHLDPEALPTADSQPVRSALPDLPQSPERS